MNGTVQYASVLSQYDLASVDRTQPDSILVGMVCDQTATPVSYCVERYCAVHICTIAALFSFGSPCAARFRTSQYGVRRGCNTGTARYAARRRHRYRTVTSSTVQYTSVLSQYDIGLVRRVRPDYIQVGTQCGVARTLVEHCTGVY